MSRSEREYSNHKDRICLHVFHCYIKVTRQLFCDETVAIGQNILEYHYVEEFIPLKVGLCWKMEME